jgi:hypothetical protein
VEVAAAVALRAVVVLVGTAVVADVEDGLVPKPRTAPVPRTSQQQTGYGNYGAGFGNYYGNTGRGNGGWGGNYGH